MLGIFFRTRVATVVGFDTTIGKLIAAIFLKERLTWRKGVVITFGVAVVALIVRPGAASLNPAIFGAVFAFTISFISTKALTRYDSATNIIFWTLVIQSIIGIALALNVWRWPSAATWPWISLARTSR